MSLTRDEQFEMAFNDFITTKFVDTGKLRTWSLNLLTKNTRKNIHDYQLVFPQKYLAYYLDTLVVLPDLTMEGPGPVYLPQEIPEMHEFVSEAIAYFGEFAYVENGVLISGVKIGAPKEGEEADKTLDIQVVYHKNCSPYPAMLTKKEAAVVCQLVNTQRCLEEAEEKYAIMIDICNRERLDLLERFDKLANVFRKMAMNAYAQEEPQDCPICLDPIATENLHVTLCGHRVCTVCNSKCTKCPLCRENY